jgi:hypothetical protein
MPSTASKAQTTQLAPVSDSGRLFFLDLGAGRVLSAKADGSDLKTIVSEGRRLPDGIVVDVAAGHIYWTNMGNFTANDGSIDRADLDGGSITNIVPAGGTFTPKQLQLDKQNGGFTGVIAKACGLCDAIWMARRSKPWLTRARATLAPAGTLGNGASVLVSTFQAGSFIGRKKARTTPARVASVVPISKFRKVRLRQIGETSRSFTTVCPNQSTWTST